MEHFFPPNSSGHLRSDAHQSQIIGGDADINHTQTIGGIYPPILPGFGTPAKVSLCPGLVYTAQLLYITSSLASLYLDSILWNKSVDKSFEVKPAFERYVDT